MPTLESGMDKNFGQKRLCQRAGQIGGKDYTRETGINEQTVEQQAKQR